MYNSFSQQLTPRLHTILRGIKKYQAASPPPRVRLPITTDILKQIRGILSHKNLLILRLCFGQHVVLPFSASCVWVSSLYLLEPLTTLHATYPWMMFGFIKGPTLVYYKWSLSNPKLTPSEGGKHLPGCNWQYHLPCQGNASIPGFERRSYWAPLCNKGG